MKKVLVVAAHPDDELLGVGGTVARHVQAGDEVYSVIACEGESLRYQKDVGQAEAIKKAAEILGVTQVFHLKFPDQRLDTYTLVDIITPLESISNEIKPDIVYCQWGGDVNRDHKILFEAATVVFRPLEKWLKEFLAFYTVSSTEWGYPRNFVPDTWVDITETIDKKTEAFRAYQSEIREYPHPRSERALENAARFFGNQSSMEAAEVFMTIRRLMRI